MSPKKKNKILEVRQINCDDFIRTFGKYLKYPKIKIK